MAISALTREATPQERTKQFRAAQHKSLWPVLFWAGVAVGQLGAIRPGWGYPWRPSAFAGAALLVGLGLLAAHTADSRFSEETWRRLRLVGQVVGTVLFVHQFTTSAHVTGASRTGSILLYGAALLVALWPRTDPRPAILIASGTRLDRMRTTRYQVVLYRARDAHEAARAEELRPLTDRLIVVEGAEHDPRAKELMSASGLTRLLPDLTGHEVYVTGPRDFARYVRGALTRLDVPARTPPLLRRRDARRDRPDRPVAAPRPAAPRRRSSHR